MDESVALFIDLENVATSMWNQYQQSLNPTSLMAKARRFGPVPVARAYADFSKPHLHDLESRLRIAGIDSVNCPPKHTRDGEQSRVDATMIFDLFEVALDHPGVKTFVLMSGDSDFVRVVSRLRNRLERSVVIAGVRGSVSWELVEAAAGQQSLIEPVPDDYDRAALIGLIRKFEDTRFDGYLPTFKGLVTYLKHPQNQHVVRDTIVEGALNAFVEAGILKQRRTVTSAGAEIKVTELDRGHPEVLQAPEAQPSTESTAP